MVDDEPMVRRAMKMLLRADSHVVVTVECGEAALEVFEAGKFDLVITDNSMPGMCY